MKILITGGAGNIASSLAKKLAELDYQVVIADNLLTGSISKIPKNKNTVFINADVNNLDDMSSIFQTNHFDYVFHYAAIVGVERTLANPISVLNDIKGIENILTLCRDHNIKRVFYSSSSEVYGEPFEIPQHEVTTPLNSRLPYAIVKNVGEAYFRSFQHEFGLDYTIFRFFNTYGPNQSEDFVIPRFIRAALKGADITIYGDGRQTRTFCYIDDNVDACITAFQDEVYINDVINIGSDIEISILDLANKIRELVGSKSKIIHLSPLKEGDMTRRCPDISKMKLLLKRELITLKEGILLLINHMNKDI